MAVIALDLFCKAGGASMGLHRAGYDVIGIDIEPQPNYPFEFVQADALLTEWPEADLVWASPPCQAYIRGGNTRNPNAPNLVPIIRDRFEKFLECGVSWIIENVPGSPIRADALLCGSMFSLQVRRHRVFQMNFRPPLPPPCDHSRPIAGVYGNPHGQAGAWAGMLPSDWYTWSEAMGIDWMTVAELSQAIPPAYSEFLARAVPA